MIVVLIVGGLPHWGDRLKLTALWPCFHHCPPVCVMDESSQCTLNVWRYTSIRVQRRQLQSLFLRHDIRQKSHQMPKNNDIHDFFVSYILQAVCQDIWIKKYASVLLVCNKMCIQLLLIQKKLRLDHTHAHTHIHTYKHTVAKQSAVSQTFCSASSNVFALTSTHCEQPN